MPRKHPASTTRAVTAGLSVAAALGIVAALADDADRVEGDRSDSTRPVSVEVIVPDDVDEGAVRDAVREWLDDGGDPPAAPPVLDPQDPPLTTSTGS